MSKKPPAKSAEKHCTWPEEETPRAVLQADAEERTATAPRPGPHGWADDFARDVPYEPINEALFRYLCELGTLLTRDTKVSAAILRGLPRLGGVTPKEEASILARIEAGDVGVLGDTGYFFDQDDIAALLAQLYGYARGGEGPSMTPEESRREIERLLGWHRRLVSMLPDSLRTEMGNNFLWLSDTLAAAEARWALDSGRSAAVPGVAALAGVRPKTIANLTAGGNLPVDAEGHIPAAAALAWLSGRKDFVPSWWQTWQGEQQPVGSENAHRTNLDEQVFVPVDGDGTPFLPSLARRSKTDGSARYAIGEKAAPEYIEDYWEALDKLSRMPTPRWRRPNPAGVGGWGLVSAQEGWRRYARRDLERMLEAVRHEWGN